MLVGQIHKIRHDHSQAVIKKNLGVAEQMLFYLLVAKTVDTFKVNPV